MKKGIELDIVVSNARETVEQFQKVFDIQIIEVQSTAAKDDTILVNMEGMNIHFLSKNDAVGFKTPITTPESLWVNIIVDDIEKTKDAAVQAGFELTIPITKEPYEGMLYMLLKDSDNYQWMVYEAK
ncbi:VOC family protein [Companilactobacillus kedongensis]|uniref:VOC family protein n=1 Tax=Companilactobacillus kedongensis TaxID=2486004 RepID=UPI000F773EE2|nr:VOC family protein [Companilactobacillus kedongensis]